MKHYFFFVFFISLISFATAQNNSFDKRLLSKFSEAELQDMSKKNAATLAYWNFYVTNAYQIADLPSEKSQAHELKGTIKIENINAVNIFDLKLTPLQKDYQYYKIEGTQKLLLILSEEQIKEKFAKSAN
jgi:hypothetical protein